MTERIIGVDVGGSGVKGALVDVVNGALAGDRIRVDTPDPATPDAVAEAVAEVVEGLGGADLIGVAIPGVVRQGVVHTAANIDGSWVGVDAVTLLSERLGQAVTVLNDADAAGVAEMRFGRGRDVDGVVFMATLGTGIGTALFVDGTLVPNTELGHIELHGGDAERYASAKVRKREDLDWDDWGRRVAEYVRAVHDLLWPDLIILGGGVSRKADKWLDYVDADLPVVAAELENEAGIIGLAMAAADAAS